LEGWRGGGEDKRGWKGGGVEGRARACWIVVKGGTHKVERACSVGGEVQISG
jgi:hypothetical protein